MSRLAEDAAVYDHTADDDRKVFVSRLPKQWDDATLALHFANIFGPVESAIIRREEKHQEKSDTKSCYVCKQPGHVSRECRLKIPEGRVVHASTISRGFGFVVFASAVSKRKALEQGSIHVLHRTIQIREVARDTNGTNGAAHDINAGKCFLWERFACPRGDSCKFRHDGIGGCIKVGAPGTGVAKCLSFKKKGRCNRGDHCPFRHEAKNKVSVIMPTSTAADAFDARDLHPAVSADDGSLPEDDHIAPKGAKIPGVCDTWRKKGKCRKGDRCRYHHVTTGKVPNHSSGDGKDDSKNSRNEGSNKRRKIDGLALIHAKKTALL